MLDPELIEILNVFLAEARGMMDEVEPRLIELQASTDEKASEETINSIFRFFHSMKGGAGSLGLKNIAGVTHEAETLLDQYRKKKSSIPPQQLDLLLQVIDFIRLLLGVAEKQQNDSGHEAEAGPLIQRLLQAISVEKGEKAATPIANAPAPETAPTPAPTAPASVVTPAPAPKTAPPAPENPPISTRDPVLDSLITPEMAEKFASESDDTLEQTEQILLEMTKSPDTPSERIKEAFRAVHSFKGNCGFMGYPDLERLSHKTEEILEQIKNGTLRANENTLRVLLGIVDALRKAVSELPRGGKGVLADCDLYLELANSILPKSAIAEPAINVAAPHAPPAPAASPSTPAPAATPPLPAAAPAVPKISGAKTPVAVPGPATSSSGVIHRDIRVNLEKLDTLINLVGELVIAEAMVTRCPTVANLEDEHFDRAVHQLRRITSDLQDIAMSVRMIPLSATFRKMIRLVHDLSAKIGKQAKLDLIGEDTEVDKTVIEQISDPLVHIVRNSIDHGLEPPEERKALGKPEVGTITIEAKHDGGEVWIIVRDDGRGLNRNKILAKAIERGIVQNDGSDLNDTQIFNLIFEPGFSTADKVTDVSGRGVGMDVVKKNIEKLRGRVDLQSTLGVGSAVILRIPLTLAVIEGMLVRVGAAHYAIPILSVRESFRPVSNQITVTPDGQEVVRVRDEFIPVVRLHEFYGKNRTKKEVPKLEDGIIIVVENDRHAASFFVDQIVGQQEIVIKALSSYFGNVCGMSGCTILGDGTVSLILDVGAIIKSAKDASKNSQYTTFHPENSANAPSALV